MVMASTRRPSEADRAALADPRFAIWGYLTSGERARVSAIPRDHWYTDTEIPVKIAPLVRVGADKLHILEFALWLTIWGSYGDPCLATQVYPTLAARHPGQIADIDAAVRGFDEYCDGSQFDPDRVTAHLALLSVREHLVGSTDLRAPRAALPEGLGGGDGDDARAPRHEPAIDPARAMRFCLVRVGRASAASQIAIARPDDGMGLIADVLAAMGALETIEEATMFLIGWLAYCEMLSPAREEWRKTGLPRAIERFEHTLVALVPPHRASIWIASLADIRAGIAREAFSTKALASTPRSPRLAP